MKTATLLLALALATNAAGVLAADDATDSMGAASARDSSQGGSFVQQIETEKARLDHAGFPQYTN